VAAHAERPLRADARRNRENLIAVARAAFTAADDTVPLEDIAREAGVGIGTLYRHFPTREALVEAVYGAELDHAGWASGRIATPTSRERITAAIETILTAGARTGSLRADVGPEDVTALILGVFLSTATNSTPEQTGRLLDLIVDALQPKTHQ